MRQPLAVAALVTALVGSGNADSRAAPVATYDFIAVITNGSGGFSVGQTMNGSTGYYPINCSGNPAVCSGVATSLTADEDHVNSVTEITGDSSPPTYTNLNRQNGVTLLGSSNPLNAFNTMQSEIRFVGLSYDSTTGNVAGLITTGPSKDLFDPWVIAP